MQPFDLDQIIAPGLLIFAATLIVSFYVNKSLIYSIIFAFLKAGTFLIYFSYFFDGRYTFLDDWTYLDGGNTLILHNVYISNLSNNIELALSVGQGDHFIYYLYNAYAIRFFGNGYYSPVALNILLTLFIAFTGATLAFKEFHFSQKFKKLFFAFLLFHPDIFAWSNIMNGKDTLVLYLHVLLLFSFSLFFEKRMLIGIALALPVTILLFFLRFYVPVFFAVAWFTSVLFMQNQRIKYIFIGLLLVIVVVWVGAENLAFAFEMLRVGLVNPFIGFVRFLLTPIPFNTEDSYGFLEIPSIMHWLLFPCVCLGVAIMIRIQSSFSRFFLFYVFIFIALYSIYGDLQGPRHRVQLDYAWAVFQFLGIIHLFKKTYRFRIQASPDVFTPSCANSKTL